MKTITKTSFLVLLLLGALTSCAPKTTAKKVTNVYNTTTNPITSTDTNGDGIPDVPVDGCDGVYRAGATGCYWTNIPRIVMSGPGTAGVTWWSSTSLPSEISQQEFVSDGNISVRMKPSAAYANEVSRQNRTCGQFLYKPTRLKVRLMVRNSNASIGEIKEMTAKVDAYSTKIKFAVPSGSTNPFIMEVVGVMSDQRCYMGSLTASMTTACNAGTYYEDIPVVSGSNPTYCAAFNLEFATDDTYDLP